MMFTPRKSARSKERFRWEDDEVVVLQGNPHVRTLGHRADVEVHGRVYAVYGANCGLPGCDCDAYVVPLRPI